MKVYLNFSMLCLCVCALLIGSTSCKRIEVEQEDVAVKDTTFQLLWAVNTPSVFTISRLFDNNFVVMDQIPNGINNMLRSHDPLTGAIKWTWGSPGPYFEVLDLHTKGNTIFFDTKKAELGYMCVDVTNGQTLWSLPDPPIGAMGRFFTVYNDFIYASEQDISQENQAYLVRFSIKDNIVGKFDTLFGEFKESGFDVRPAKPAICPITNGDTIVAYPIYFTNFDTNVKKTALIGVNLQTRQEVWRRTDLLEAERPFSGLRSGIVHDGYLYILKGSYLHKIDPATGETVWSYFSNTLGLTTIGIEQSHFEYCEFPLFLNGVIYAFPSYGKIIAINEASGALMWSSDLKESGIETPRIFEYKNHIITGLTSLVIIDKQSGIIKHRLQSGGQELYAHLIVDTERGLVYVTNTARRRIECYKINL